MPDMNIAPKFLPVMQIPKRFKVMVGGRGSGKSMTVADLLLMKVQTERAKVGCFREYQNSLAESSLALFKSEIERLGLEGFSYTNTEVRHVDGGVITFHGLARSIDAVKSMHGYNYFFVEEAQFLSETSIKILTPTVREEGSEIWMIGNPMASGDPFSQRFLVPFQNTLDRDGHFEDDMHIVTFVNYKDNPFFPAVLDRERLFDKETIDAAVYDHIWLGAYNDSVEDAIIKAEWFDSCVDAHLKIPFKVRGADFVSHDPADLGADSKGLVHRRGSLIVEAMTRDFGDVNEGCDWATEYAIQNRADYFIFDGDGIGLSLRRQVSQAFHGRHIEPVMFRGSKSPERPDDIYERIGADETQDREQWTNLQTFKNRRSQRYWMLRDRVYNTYLAVTKRIFMDEDKMISFSSKISELQALRSEVCRIPRKPNPSGLIQIMPKPEMKRLLQIKSPNLADSIMMSLHTPVRMNFMSQAPQPEAEAAY